MEHILKRVKQVRTKLLSVVVLLGLAIVLTVPFIISTLEEKKAVVEQLQKIQQITSDIVYYDEVLTMSARMYAYSQKASWIARYNEYAKKLDEKLSLAQAFDPDIKNAIQLTSAANDKLIGIETRSFELADKGDILTAVDSLTNQEYQTLKAEYEKHVLQSLTDVKTKTQNRLDELDSSRVYVLDAILVFLAVAFFSVWVFLLRYFKYSDHTIDELMVSLNKKIDMLDKSKKQLTIANQAKDRFLANVSHEIRTPLNSVYGTLQLIKANPSQDNIALVDNALTSSKALLAIVSDILDVSKIEANMITLEHKYFSAKRIAQSVINELKLTIKGQTINIELIIDNSFNDGWMGDPIRIRQILTNLTSNALKFTDEGKISIELTSQHTDKRECLVIVVTDTGIGMSAQTLNVLFECFSQADESMTRKQEGLGLGMTITSRLVDLMKGTIDVQSELAKGTIFTVTLPLESVELQMEENEPIEVNIPDLTGKKILVVEDNRINQTIIKKMLKRTHANVDVAENGVLAIEKYTSFEPDVILMDIQMPEMDGVEACKKIRKLNKDIPILAVTANVILEDVKFYLSSGFSGHLGKPIEADLLYRAIKKLLSHIDEPTSIS